MNDREIFEFLISQGWEEHYVNKPYVKYYRFRVPTVSGWEYFYLDRSAHDARLCLHSRFVENRGKFRSIDGVSVGGKKGDLLLKSADMLEYQKTTGRTGDAIPEFFPISFFSAQGLTQAVRVIADLAGLQPKNASSNESNVAPTSEIATGLDQRALGPKGFEESNSTKEKMLLSPTCNPDIGDKNALLAAMAAEVREIDAEFDRIPGDDIDVIAKKRVGQGVFRMLLERELGTLCWVSGLATKNLLIASHIVPWSKVTKDQKTDPDNGLLLSVTWDALFDKGFISFDDYGQLLKSELLSDEAIRCLGISNNARLPNEVLSDARRANLAWHRRHFGFPAESDSRG